MHEYLTWHDADPEDAVEEGDRQRQLQRAGPGQVQEPQGLLQERDVHRDQVHHLAVWMDGKK